MTDDHSTPWIDYLDVPEEYISLYTNDETKLLFSDDFEAVGLDQEAFSDLVYEKINSSGEVRKFRRNMQAIAQQVHRGECSLLWVTCEQQDSRLDIRFRPKHCECSIYEGAVQSWPGDVDDVYELAMGDVY